MARRMFTEEQVRRMAENPYTLHVSTTQIKFTKAFKEEFWRQYFTFVTTGIYPLDIPNKPSPPAIPKAPNELGVVLKGQIPSESGDT